MCVCVCVCARVYRCECVSMPSLILLSVWFLVLWCRCADEVSQPVGDAMPKDTDKGSLWHLAFASSLRSSRPCTESSHVLLVPSFFFPPSFMQEARKVALVN